MGRVAEAVRPKPGGGGKADQAPASCIAKPSPPGLRFAATTLPMKGREKVALRRRPPSPPRREGLREQYDHHSPPARRRPRPAAVLSRLDRPRPAMDRPAGARRADAAEHALGPAPRPAADPGADRRGLSWRHPL